MAVPIAAFEAILWAGNPAMAYAIYLIIHSNLKNINFFTEISKKVRISVYSLILAYHLVRMIVYYFSHPLFPIYFSVVLWLIFATFDSIT